MQKSERQIDEDSIIRDSRYLVHALLPFLKQFRQEQLVEKEIEAKIQGITSLSFVVPFLRCLLDVSFEIGLPSSEMKIEQAATLIDERSFW